MHQHRCTLRAWPVRCRQCLQRINATHVLHKRQAQAAYRDRSKEISMRKDTHWHHARVVSVADACQGVREIVLDPGANTRSFEVGSHLDFRLQPRRLAAYVDLGTGRRGGNFATQQ